MNRSYYKGVALDYTAREYDDDYSLQDYFKRYHKECCTKDDRSSNISATTFVEGDVVKEPYTDNITAFLRTIFCCW